jgi:hypothetical protein
VFLLKTQPEVVYPIIPFPTSRPHFHLILPISSSIFSHPFPLTHVPSSLFPHHSPSPLITGPFLSPLSLSRYLSLHPCAIATLNINPPSPSLILSYLLYHRSSSSLLATPSFLSTHIQYLPSFSSPYSSILSPPAPTFLNIKPSVLFLLLSYLFHHPSPLIFLPLSLSPYSSPFTPVPSYLPLIPLPSSFTYLQSSLSSSSLP